MNNSNKQQREAPNPSSRARGCLLGGAVGDALGAPVEFLKRREIEHRFGPAGITDYARAWGSLGRITDDTQMTLFTADGLLRAWIHGCGRGITTYTGLTAASYQRWLTTQDQPSDTNASTPDGWLLQQSALHDRRAPGNTCLAALRGAENHGQPASNNSKDCGGVMRVAPVGLFAACLGNRMPANDTFDLARDLAGLTHGHPTGQMPAGVLAVVIREVVTGSGLSGALATAKACLREQANHAETLAALEQAEATADSPASRDAVATLGEGWIAEEALAIAVYCALVADDFASGVILAVNHDGDSDSTGAITGNILGALHGEQVLPAHWLEPLELRDVIAEIATDLVEFPGWPVGEYTESTPKGERIIAKYLGSQTREPGYTAPERK